MTEAIKEKARAFTTKQLVGLVLAIVVFVVSYSIPGNELLTHEGITAIGILLSAVCMWFCGTMATGVVGLLACLALFVSHTSLLNFAPHHVFGLYDGFACHTPTPLVPVFPFPAYAFHMRPHSSVYMRYRNLNLLSIGYVLRPLLRPRLTQSRSALLWKP